MGDGDSITVENIEDEVARVVEQTRDLQSAALNLLNKDETAEQSLRQRAQSLDASIRRLRSLIDSLLSSKLLDPKLADKARPLLDPLNLSTMYDCFAFFVFEIF